MTDHHHSAASRSVRNPDRLAAVRSTGLLDSQPEESFDRLTRLAVRLVGVPVAFVSLVDEFRDFYKSQCGFGEPLSTVRELEGTTFCHFAIDSDGPLVIPDTRADPVFRKVPTVESLGIAAYAGVPIRDASGAALGSFCAVDFVPRQWTTSDIEVLIELALSAEREIQLRSALRAAEASASHAQALNEQLLTQTVELRESVNDRESLLQIARLAQQEAEDANQAKSRFLANMSHELRTPLNAITGYAELLEVGVGGTLSPDQQTYVERIKRSGSHLLLLIGEILDLAKIEAGGLEVQLSELQLGPIAETALSMIMPQAAAKELKVVGDYRCPRADPFLGDEDRVRQIIINLLSNAVKFTDSGGTITLGCKVSASGPPDAPEMEAGWVKIYVQDVGIGIAAENLGRVFESFRQVENQHTRQAGGTGLGLTISRKLARLMGGEVTAESNLGYGSCFTLWLRKASSSPELS